MVDDRPEARPEDLPEDIGPSPDPGRAKREPPTIDLEATEVSGAIPDAGPGASRRSMGAIASAIVAAVTGAVTAALVIAAAWYLGWPGEPAPPPAPSAPQVNTEAIDGLAARIASVESKTSAPVAAPDPAAAAHIEALEKSIGSLRGELAAARAQSDKLAAAVDTVKSAPAESSPPPDLSAINERLAQIERTTSAQSAEIAQEGAKIADSKPADDAPLRRVVAAALLDVQVRTGEPFSSTLAAAKSLATNVDALKSLDGFAASGVPSVAALSRELLTLVPKLSPPAPENATTGTGLVDRMEAGAVKLLRIQRTDAVGTDRGAVVARITAAALRNDVTEARRELNSLAPADRAAAQAWIDKADARDAALAASRQFAADAMAALAKPGQ
jgi:hypothetical protein